jgi:hypothetical protein
MSKYIINRINFLNPLNLFNFQESNLKLKKILIMKTKIILFVFMLSLLTISCSKQENEDNGTELISVEEAIIESKIDIATDDVAKIIDSQLTQGDGFSGRDEFGTQDFLPLCVTITRVPEFGIALTPGTLVTKTIDFGTVGCVMPNGNILKGKIIISFTFNPTATTHIINYTFDNFYHNATKFVGTKSITRAMTVATATSPSHPIVTMDMDMTVTFANNAVVQRVGTRTREIIAGFLTPILMDNVFKITGNWTTTMPNTTIKTSTITTPLILKANCNHIVKGVITFVRNGNTAALDFGNGTCDNQAIFTANNVSTVITLGN